MFFINFIHGSNFQRASTPISTQETKKAFSSQAGWEAWFISTRFKPVVLILECINKVLDGKSFLSVLRYACPVLKWPWTEYLQQELEHLRFPVGDGYEDALSVSHNVFQHHTEPPICQQFLRNFGNRYQTYH